MKNTFFPYFRIVFYITCFFYVSVFMPIEAQSFRRPLSGDASWQYLQKAEIAFEERNYGEAMGLTLEAKAKRQKEVEWAGKILQNALIPFEVRQVGDAIPDVIAILQERNAYEALEIINDVVLHRGTAAFNNSISALYGRILGAASYPEADYLLGKLYMVEAEYDLALTYFTSAWKESGKLDVPARRTDILYDMAELARLQKDDDTYEKTLLLVLEENPVITESGGDTPFVRAVKNSLKTKIDLDQFFMLYRNDTYLYLPAFSKLSDYYFLNNRSDMALSYGVMAALTAFTKLYQAIKDRNIEYTYTTFGDYLVMVSRYYEIAEWSVKNDIWKIFFDFSMILRSAGYTPLSQEILAKLSQYCPENYWRRLALKELFENY